MEFGVRAGSGNDAVDAAIRIQSVRKYSSRIKSRVMKMLELAFLAGMWDAMPYVGISLIADHWWLFTFSIADSYRNRY